MRGEERPVLSGAAIRGWWAAAAVVLLSLLSLALWRIEVELIKGWAGLHWLNGYPRAAVPICALVATSILVAVLAAAPRSAWDVIRSRGVTRTCVTFIATATGVAWLSFEITRRWLETNNAWLMFSPASLMTRLMTTMGWLLQPVGSIALCAVGIFVAIDRLLLRLRPWSIALFVAALVLVMPASWVLLQLVPAHGYTDEIHAIKAGYPTLWTNVLMGGVAAVAARFGRRASGGAPEKSGQRDRLDAGRE